MILLRRDFKIIVLSVFVLTLVLFFTQSAYAQNGALYFSPSSGTVSVGQLFSIVLRVNTGGTAVNAAEGSVVFDPAKLSVSSISKSGSIFTVWASEPSFSNAEGSIEFAGGLPNPGYSGSNGLVLTINFRAKTSTSIRGSTDITLVSGGILANDGYGTNILSSLGKAVYVIFPGVIEPAPVPTEPGVAIPGLPRINITSSTHPDQSKWYSNKDPVFKWDLPLGVREVSLVLSRKANSLPIINYSPPISEKALTDLEDGVWYLNGRFRTLSGLGTVTSFKFSVDTQLPSAFSITRLDIYDPTNPRPELLFESSDVTSGIEKYQIKIGTSAWLDIDPALAGMAYAIPLQKYGDYAVEVKAIDRASNSTSAKLDIKIEPIKATVIKEITKEASEGKPITIEGTAEPNRKIIIELSRNGDDFLNFVSTAYAQQIDENHFTYETVADENGNWSIEITDLPTGTYRVGARAQDERQAISEISNIVSTEVKKGILEFISKMFDILVNILSKGWFLIATGAVIASLIILIIKKVAPFIADETRKIRHIASEYQSSKKLKIFDSKTKLEFKILQKDIKKELELLNKIANHRSLHPEESYLRNKLEKYYNILKKL